MRYGELPISLGTAEVELEEMMFYQYLPIKLAHKDEIVINERLSNLLGLIGTVINDFIKTYGQDRFLANYVYVTVKRMYQPIGTSFNRKGYHSDGFMTDDINYIWSDECPTEFNFSKFNLTQDDFTSLIEMEEQASPENIYIFDKKELIRLTQYNIHRVSESCRECMRTFVKVSFSKDKYDLKGNSINYGLDYKWEMKERSINRNIPQSKITK